MALLSKRDFAGKCGMPTNALSVFITRAKVKVTISELGELVDDNDPVNVLFFATREAKGLITAAKVSKNEQAAPEKQGKSTKKASDPKQKKSTSGHVRVNKEPDNELVKSKREFDQVKLSREKRELEKLNIEIAKKKGDLIPTGAVLALFKQFGKAIQSAYRSENEQWILDLKKDLQLNDTQVSTMRKNAKTAINNAVIKSVETATREVDSIVKDFSDRRGVGDHD